MEVQTDAPAQGAGPFDLGGSAGGVLRSGQSGAGGNGVVVVRECVGGREGGPVHGPEVHPLRTPDETQVEVEASEGAVLGKIRVECLADSRGLSAGHGREVPSALPGIQGDAKQDPLGELGTQAHGIEIDASGLLHGLGDGLGRGSAGGGGQVVEGAVEGEIEKTLVGKEQHRVQAIAFPGDGEGGKGGTRVLVQILGVLEGRGRRAPRAGGSGEGEVPADPLDHQRTFGPQQLRKPGRVVGDCRCIVCNGDEGAARADCPRPVTLHREGRSGLLGQLEEHSRAEGLGPECGARSQQRENRPPAAKLPAPRERPAITRDGSPAHGVPLNHPSPCHRATRDGVKSGWTRCIRRLKVNTNRPVVAEGHRGPWRRVVPAGIEPPTDGTRL